MTPALALLAVLLPALAWAQPSAPGGPQPIPGVSQVYVDSQIAALKSGNTVYSGNPTFIGSGIGINVSNTLVARQTILGSPTYGGVYDGTSTLSIYGNPTYTSTSNPTFLSSTTAAGNVTSGSLYFNNINITDAVHFSGGGDTPTGLYVQHITAAGAIGPRVAMQINEFLTGAASGSGLTGYSALALMSDARASAGGSSGTHAGNMGGANFTALIETSAGLYWSGIQTLELDVAAQSGTSVDYKHGLQIVQLVSDSVHGALSDYGMGFASQPNGSEPGWNIGIAFAVANGWFGFPATASLIAAETPAGGGPAMTVAYGMKLDNITFTSGFLKSTNFLVDGSGNTTVLTVKVGANQVVGARQTGWTAPTGILSRAAFDQSTVTLAVLAQHVAAMQTDLTTHGMIGP